MADNIQMISMLREEYTRWQELLMSLTEDQISEPSLQAGLSIKDIVAHLWAWQLISTARLEAAASGHEPVYPDWTLGVNPDKGDLDEINARIYRLNHQKSWSKVYENWQTGFLRFISLGDSFTEEALQDRERFPWLERFALIDVLQGSYEHHHFEHLEPLLQTLKRPESEGGRYEKDERC